MFGNVQLVEIPKVKKKWKIFAGSFIKKLKSSSIHSIHSIQLIQSLIKPVCKFEAFIKKYEGSILHSNHMLLTNLKYSLSGFYGRLPGYEMEEMNATTLSRKKEICEETLQVLNKIDPGISPRRGMFLFAFQHIFSLRYINTFYVI